MGFNCAAREAEQNGSGGVVYFIADICAEHNKNLLFMSFCSCLVIFGTQAAVVIDFLLFGNTKNVCDGSFGDVKRLQRRTDAKTRRK